MQTEQHVLSGHNSFKKFIAELFKPTERNNPDLGERNFFYYLEEVSEPDEKMAVISVLPSVGEKLSISNNDFHPLLDVGGASDLVKAVELFRANLDLLLPVVSTLKNNGIEHREFLTSLNNIHSYIYIIEATLALDKNARVANYAYSKLGGVK